MRSLSNVAVLLAFLVVWYTWSQADMVEKANANHSASGSSQRNNSSFGNGNNASNNRGNNKVKRGMHGGSVNGHQQERGQQSFGIVAPGSYQQSYMPVHNGNQTVGYVPQQVAYSNGNCQEHQAVPSLMQVPNVPLGYLMQPPNMANDQPFAVQNGPEAMYPNFAPHNFPQGQVYYSMPSSGQQNQLAAMAPQPVYSGYPAQQSFPVPSTPLLTQQIPQQQAVPAQQYRVQGVSVYDNHRQTHPATNVVKPPLFVNLDLIQPGSVFTNSDGYTEEYTSTVGQENATQAGYSQQPVTYDEYERKAMNQPIGMSEVYQRNGGHGVSQLNGMSGVYQQSGAAGSFYQNGVPVAYHQNGVPVLYQQNGVPVLYQQNGAPTTNHHNGAPVTYQQNGPPVTYQQNEAFAPNQQNGAPATNQQNGAPATNQQNGAPATNQQNGAPVTYQQNDALGGFKRSSVPVAYQQNVGQKTFKSSGVSGSFPQNGANGGSQQNEAPRTAQHNGGQGSYQHKRAPHVHQKNAANATYQQNGVSGGPRSNATYQSNGATAGGHQQNGGQGLIQKTGASGVHQLNGGNGNSHQNGTSGGNQANKAAGGQHVAKQSKSMQLQFSPITSTSQKITLPAVGRAPDATAVQPESGPSTHVVPNRKTVQRTPNAENGTTSRTIAMQDGTRKKEVVKKETPDTVQDDPTAELKTALKEIIPTLEAFKFNGLNFPVVSKNGPSAENYKEYENLLAIFTEMIKEFFQTREELWYLSDVKSRGSPSDDYVFLDVPLTPDEGIAFISETITPAADSRDHSPLSDDLTITNSEEVFYMDYFLPREPIKVPKRFLKKNDAGGYYHGPSKNCLLLDNQDFSLIEKSVSVETLKKKQDGGFLPIKFGQSEKEHIFNLLRSGMEATIVLYAEFPSEQQDSDASAGNEEATGQRETTGEQQTSEQSGRHPRASRSSGYTSQNGTQNRGRSASNLGSSTVGRTSRLQPWDPRAYNLPEFRALAGETSQQNRSGPPRRLPALPQEYLNGQGTSSNTAVSPRTESGSDLPPRRRHQSQDGAERSQEGPYPQPWMNEHAHLRFIIPTERELMAPLPFPPFRMPLIGVARREPGQPYVQHRVLPAHENFDIFRLRMREIRDSAMPSRGSGALLLEPRGYLNHHVMNGGEDEDEDSSESSTHHDQQEMGDECDSRMRASLEQEEEEEEERKRRETASTCKNVSPYLRYHHGSSDDDDEDEGTGKPSCSNAISSCALESTPNSSNTGTSSSNPNSGKGKTTPSSSKNSKNRCELKKRPVKDTAAKNQKRREKDQRRALRKEEAIEQMKIAEEHARIKQEQKVAELKLAAEKRRIEKEKLERKRAIEEVERKAREESDRIAEEERKAEIEHEKAQKRKLLSVLNKEKKKIAKHNKYLAAEKAKEEEAERRRKIEQLLGSGKQRAVDLGILRRLNEVKTVLEKEEKTRAIAMNNSIRKSLQSADTSANKDITLRNLIEPVICELEVSEKLDSRTIRERSDKLNWYFENDESFKCDIADQLKCSEEGRFKMTVGICKLREAAASKKFFETRELIHAKAVRQYRHWAQNMYSDLSFFINFMVGLYDLRDDDPTIAKFEEWTIYDNPAFTDSTTSETNL